jgi:hypothetical protein
MAEHFKNTSGLKVGDLIRWDNSAPCNLSLREMASPESSLTRGRADFYVETSDDVLRITTIEASSIIRIEVQGRPEHRFGHSLLFDWSIQRFIPADAEWAQQDLF